ncbi:hypothetical protein [Cellulomonas denverensis]|uniref:hypothetical protein n=1 Tax=Cellulomonas denverensis TaxID=264297 RepID=UPI001446B2D7|nr:hypothetical protein [Cellulomonas denverensis]
MTPGRVLLVVLVIAAVVLGGSTLASGTFSTTIGVVCVLAVIAGVVAWLAEKRRR